MKRVLCARWWGVGWWVLAALLLVTSCSARPSPDSDAESWRPISGRRVNRYRTALSLGSGEQVLHRRRRHSPTDCAALLANHTELDSLAKVLCFSYNLFQSKNETSVYLDNHVVRKRGKSGTHEKSEEVHVNDRLPRPKNNLSVDCKTPLVLDQRTSFNGSSAGRIIVEGPIFESGTARRRRRRSTRAPRKRAQLKKTVVKVQQPLSDEELEWLPVPLAPPNKEDTKTNLITQDLVQSFVSNTLSDLKYPQQSAGTLVQIMTPLLTKEPSDSKWGSMPLNPHKRPSVILVQDTPEEFLPKPSDHHSHHHYQVPRPESHKPSVPQPFPRPTYHYPRPSPEPPPKPTYHYPSSEPYPEPNYEHTSSTHKPHPVHHYHVNEPHFPYTSVIIHTSTSVHPEPLPEPSPEPSWASPLADYPEQEVETPQTGPEIVVGTDDSASESSTKPPSSDSVQSIETPSRPSPPPIYIFATPIPPAGSPGSALNPVTISSGRPPPSIVILSSPEDAVAAAPPLADPVAPVAAAGGAGGGGLIPIVPILPPIAPIVPVPVVPGLLGSSGGPGSGGGLAGSGNSNCPSVQVFNYQTISNTVENKDCVINLNAPVHNSIGDEQIEAPSDDILYDDIPDSSTVATTTKKPSSGSMTILEFIQDFISSMTIFNPISMSFLSFLFAPVSILLASGVGVAALVLPWVFPSYWFGRRSHSSKRQYSYGNSQNQFRESTLRFERSVQSGVHLEDFLDSIGLL